MKHAQVRSIIRPERASCHILAARSSLDYDEVSFIFDIEQNRNLCDLLSRGESLDCFELLFH